MASFTASLPLPVIGSSRTEQEHPEVEYEVVPEAPEDSRLQTSEMGYDEQMLKPEAKEGDIAALYAVYVSLEPLRPESVITSA